MSSHFEMVLSCFLRADTPPDVLATLRWHLGEDGASPSPNQRQPGAPLLRPNPDCYLPGGDIASLQYQLRGHRPSGPHYGWGLFSRTFWLDDDLENLASILDLLAPHVAEDGFGGSLREEFDTRPTVFLFRQGTYVLVGPNADD